MEYSNAPAERWLPVVDYEGLYEVSDLGRVRSVDRRVTYSTGAVHFHRGRILKLFRNADGYYVVGLHKNHYQRPYGVHLLVLRAFVGPCPGGMEGCHGPAGQADSSPGNLRYDTHLENMRDRVREGNHPESQKTHCPLNHPLVEPNLRPSDIDHGWRHCLACSRTKTNGPDRQAVADEHYFKIMELGHVAGFRIKESCPRSHLLIGPNLKPSSLAKGRRRCLACDRAFVMRVKRRGQPFDFQSYADAAYQKIMKDVELP